MHDSAHVGLFCRSEQQTAHNTLGPEIQYCTVFDRDILFNISISLNILMSDLCSTVNYGLLSMQQGTCTWQEVRT